MTDQKFIDGYKEGWEDHQLEVAKLVGKEMAKFNAVLNNIPPNKRDAKVVFNGLGYILKKVCDV